MGNSLEKIIAISGATGFIGKNLSSYLTKTDIEHIQITRAEFNRKELILLPKCFCFVHLIGIGSKTSEKSFQQVNVKLTKKAIDICKKSKIKKFIYFSGLGVSKNSKSDYFISKFDSEQLIINSGLDYTIFRPSYIIGKDDYLTLNIQKQIRQKKIWIPDAGQYVIQPITINDACKIIHISTESKEIFSLVKKFNYKVEFMRPKYLPNDKTVLIDVMNFVINILIILKIFVQNYFIFIIPI